MRIHTVFSLVGCSRVPAIGSASCSELVEMIVPIVHLIRQFGGNLRNLTTNFFHIEIKLNYLVILIKLYCMLSCGMWRSRRTFKPVQYLSSFMYSYTQVHDKKGTKFSTAVGPVYTQLIRIHTRSRPGWHFLQSHNMDSFWKWV